MSQIPDDPNVAPPPAPLDPWEARERERARYSRPTSAPSRKPSSVERASQGSTETSEPVSYPVIGLLASVAMLLAGDSPELPDTLRPILTVTGSAMLLLLFAFVRSYADNLWVALRRGPNPWIAAMLAWSVFAFYNSPWGAVSGTSLAASHLVRVLVGVLIYFLAAYGLRSPRELTSAVTGLIGLMTLAALFELYDMGRSGALNQFVHVHTIFGSHETIGTLLMLPLPLALAFMLSRETEEKRRLLCLAAVLILGTALLIARARSAWIGLGVSVLLLLVFTAWRRAKERGGARRGSSVLMERALPVVLLIGALGAVLAFGGAASFVKERASLVRMIQGSESRLDLWKAGARMTVDRPLTGWGLGGFLVLQGRWSHTGDDVIQALTGNGHRRNYAHSYYIQWAADTGVPGLILHVGAIAAFLISGIGTLRRLRNEALDLPPFQQALLAGCIAGVAGACVDALAAPSYSLHSPSAIFWLLIGLGVAAQRPLVPAAFKTAGGEPDAPAPVPALPPTAPLSVAASALVGAAAAALVLSVGYRQRAIGRQVPRGTFQITVERQRKAGDGGARGPLVAGERVLWRAQYRDETGQRVNTFPGTLWEFSAADTLSLEQMKRSAAFSRFGREESREYDSVLSVALPAGMTQPVIARAVFFDTYSRRYEAWSSLSIPSPSTPKRRAPKQK
ncbi:MAG: O-antigen ligase family protein [Cytophagales bacterium]|nr:O-antigen ligase family protein [Armatimonadota bacterium]